MAPIYLAREIQIGCVICCPLPTLRWDSPQREMHMYSYARTREGRSDEFQARVGQLVSNQRSVIQGFSFNFCCPNFCQILRS